MFDTFNRRLTCTAPTVASDTGNVDLGTAASGIKGGQTDVSKVTKDLNIGVIAEGTLLKLYLSKALTGLDSVTFSGYR